MPCTFDQQFGRTPPKRLSIPSSRLSIQSFTSLSRPPALLSIRSPVLPFLGHPYVCNLYSHSHQPTNQPIVQAIRLLVKLCISFHSIIFYLSSNLHIIHRCSFVICQLSTVVSACRAILGFLSSTDACETF